MVLPGILLAVAAAGSPSGVEGTKAKPVPPMICEVRSVHSPDSPKVAGRRFSAAKILDLEFRAVVKRWVEGSHNLRFRVFTPQGHLYQELSVPFELDRKASRAVKARLPVGGTSISTSSLYGKWRVEPFFDDDQKACGAGLRFVITE